MDALLSRVPSVQSFSGICESLEGQRSLGGTFIGIPSINLELQLASCCCQMLRIPPPPLRLVEVEGQSRFFFDD